MIRFFNVHYPIRGLILPTGEGFVAITSFFIAIWIRFGAQSQVVLSQQQAFAKIFSVSVVGLACSYFCDPYTPERHGSQGESYCHIFTSVGSLALLLAAITYAFPVLLVGSGVLPMGLI